MVRQEGESEARRHLGQERERSSTALRLGKRVKLEGAWVKQESEGEARRHLG